MRKRTSEDTVSSFMYTKDITIDHTKVDGDMQNFPVLIANTSLNFSNHVQSDGNDFVFVEKSKNSKYIAS